MIDRLIEILGSMQKKTRTHLLRTIDLVTWFLLIIDLTVGLPLSLEILNFFICTVMLLMTFKVISMGGWWWTNDGE